MVELDKNMPYMQTMKIGLGKQARGLTLFHDQLMLIIIAGHEMSHTLGSQRCSTMHILWSNLSRWYGKWPQVGKKLRSGF